VLRQDEAGGCVTSEQLFKFSAAVPPGNYRVTVTLHPGTFDAIALRSDQKPVEAPPSTGRMTPVTNWAAGELR
jgi:hypothetical protein